MMNNTEQTQAKPTTGAQEQNPNTDFNQGVHNLILMRIDEEIKRNPDFGQYIDEAFMSNDEDLTDNEDLTTNTDLLKAASKKSTKELMIGVAMELSLIIPELVPIFKSMGVFDEEGSQENAVIKSPPQQQMQSEQSDNPLLDDNRLSKGLMG